MKSQTFIFDIDDHSQNEALQSWDSPQTLVLAFGPADLLDDSKPLQRLAGLFPQSHIAGCSTSGSIIGLDIIDDAIGIAVVRFDNTDLVVAGTPVAGAEDSREAGMRLAHQLLRDDLKSILVLSDGLHVNGTSLIEGLNAVLPPDVIVTGGLAGDADRFQRTWVLHSGEPLSNHVVAVGFYGDAVRVGHGSQGGWDIFGVERQVTRAEGNVLYELDGRPALALYKEYLGERAEGLPATALLFPLTICQSDDTGQLVRTVLAVDEDSGSMTFAGDIPQGARVQLMRANFDRLIDGASGAAGMIDSASTAGSDTLVISISCVGRRLVLGERTEEEVEAVLDELPDGTRQIGFYSYGEISPSGIGSCELHNQTMTLTTLSEA